MADISVAGLFREKMKTIKDPIMSMENEPDYA